MEYPDGWVEDYHYDAIGQLLKVEDTDPSKKDMKQQKHVYKYDACGNSFSELPHIYSFEHKIINKSQVEILGNLVRRSVRVYDMSCSWFCLYYLPDRPLQTMKKVQLYRSKGQCYNKGVFQGEVS